MIRNATKFDIPRIIEMLWHYHSSGNIKNLSIDNDKSALKILTIILMGGGVAFVSEKDNKITGMLLAVMAPFLWDQTKLVMNEICYWVEPEYRGSSAGYRLIKEYTSYCEELKDQNRIINYTMSQMSGQNLNYERFGLRPIECTWSN